MVISWEHHTTKESHMPKRAFAGGKDESGGQIYIGRAKHNGCYLPAKIIPEKNICYVSFDGEEISVDEFEVLCGDNHKFTWEPASHGDIKHNSVAAGKVNDEKIYIGRAVYNGAMLPGRVSVTDKCIYVSSEGKEYNFPHYEILVYHPSRESLITWGSFGGGLFSMSPP